MRSFTRMPSFDPSAMRMAIQDGALEHVQVGRGVFQGTITHSATSGLRTAWGSYNLPVQARGQLKGDALTLGVFIGGQDAWRVLGAPACSGDMVLLREGGELLVNLPPQAQWLALQVSRERLESAGVPLDGLRGASAWRMGEIDGDAGCRQLAALLPMLAPLEATPACLDFAIPEAQEQLLTALLCEWERRRAARGERHAEALQADKLWRVVRRAEDYIEANPQSTLRIDDLCSAACTSLSTLQRAFREAFGLSPRRYLALRRLAGVRNELLNGSPGLSITEVAARWGFFHLGRFAQEYGQLFHERPSETKARWQAPS
ncbi:helix-turn-helix domain-containing protein [Ramlibacter solisilvae]